MIRLFLSDIDGCLSEPYRAFDLGAFARLRAWAARAEEDATYPRLSVCSGRAYAYVEAVAQALDLRVPALFESGGGLFDLPTARIRWNPALTSEVERELGAVRQFFLETVLSQDAGFALDYGKRAQAGLVHPDPAMIPCVLPAVRDFVTRRFPNLHVYETPVSVDVVPAALTKRQAIRWLAGEEGLALNEIAFVGDTRGDAEALAAVGHGFAPQNAALSAKEAARRVTRGAGLAGVEEAYRLCVAANRREARQARARRAA